MTVTSEGLPLNSKFKIRREERVSRFHTQRPLVLLFAMQINNMRLSVYGFASLRRALWLVALDLSGQDLHLQ